MFEVIVKEALWRHFASLNLVNAAQHGFLASRSTLTEFTLSVLDWMSAFDAHLQADMIFVAFQKALTQFTTEIYCSNLNIIA